MSGLETRGFIRSLEDAQAVLAEHGAKNLGEYIFTDVLYAPDGPVNLEKARVRIRYFTITNRGNLPSVRYDEYTYEGKNKSEFSTFPDAEYYLRERFPTAREVVRFTRRGTEYQLSESSVFIEDVEGVGTMAEVEADEQRYIDELVVALHITPIKDSLATVAYQKLGTQK